MIVIKVLGYLNFWFYWSLEIQHKTRSLFWNGAKLAYYAYNSVPDSKLTIVSLSSPVTISGIVTNIRLLRTKTIT